MSDKEGDEDARHDEQDNVFWREALKQPIPIHLHSSLGKAVSKSLAKKVKASITKKKEKKHTLF